MKAPRPGDVLTGREFLGLALQGAAGMAEQHRFRLTFDQAAHHGTGRHAVDVADHRTELDARIVQHLVQPVDLAGADAAKLAAASARPGATRADPSGV